MSTIESVFLARTVTPPVPEGFKPWREIARPQQIRPDNCRNWIVRGGRGSGKTRLGAEDCLERIRSGDIDQVHLLAPTRDDVQLVMIEGSSGILACARPGEISDVKRDYNKSDLTLRFSNGVYLRGFSGVEADRLNGPQAGHCWTDEFYAIPVHTIKQMRLGNRVGRRVTATYTSTPKPTDSTDYVLKLPDAIVYRMATRDNIANLDPGFVDELYNEFRGTRQERVELEGEVEVDIDGALWKSSNFLVPGFRRRAFVPGHENEWAQVNGSRIVSVVVAVDPTVSDPGLKKDRYKKPDECGIIVAGMDENHEMYLLADLSLLAEPVVWARVALSAYNRFKASSVVYESNQGGELVRQLFKTLSPNAILKSVHASQGKRARAEPVQSLYEQGRVHHCNDATYLNEHLINASLETKEKILTLKRQLEGAFEKVEYEMTHWDARDPASSSPNRLDALVWAAHGLRLVTVTGIRRQSMHGRAVS